jgi:hypothetical protein
MRLLRNCPAAFRKLSPTGRCRVHHQVAAASTFGIRGLAAGLWRASGERGGRAPTFESVAFKDYIAGMKRLIVPVLGLAMAASSAPALADAGNFTLVNRTGANISTLQIRRVGTSAWQPLTGSPSSGARVAVAFANPDCAFDIRAILADGNNATFAGVNLCDVTVVTLNRGQGGQLWVDYD